MRIAKACGVRVVVTQYVYGLFGCDGEATQIVVKANRQIGEAAVHEAYRMARAGNPIRTCNAHAANGGVGELTRLRDAKSQA